MSEDLRIAVVLGTRPEAIKLAPVLRRLQEEPGVQPILVSTGQHRDMLDQMLATFRMQPDIELAVMAPRQGLAQLTARLTDGLAHVFDEHLPHAVLVQGDTTTALVGALTAFYARVPVGHVEAGLRSGFLGDPFPEEANRLLVGRLARWHFAPTTRAKGNLAIENIHNGVEVTGNTGIDNLVWARDHLAGARSVFEFTRGRRVLVTLHRRENQGATMHGLARALVKLARRGDVEIVLPMHKSPAVREVLLPALAPEPAIRIVEPLDYPDFVASLSDCDLVLTDSGGIQEEAPSFGKPVLVLRETTERPEAVEAGTSLLIGTDPDVVERHATRLLDDPVAYAAMARAVNPFGDGYAASRIVDRVVGDLRADLGTVLQQHDLEMAAR